MKKRKQWITLILITFLLLIASIVFSLMRADDPYRYFTGMGSSFDLSPDDEHYIFSYYLNGKENIYRSNADGTDIEQITDSSSERLHHPKYSSEASQILFLGENPDRVNTLYVADQNGKEQKSLTTGNIHVEDAVFSVTGKEVFFTGIPAESFNKVEGEATDGYDLFSVDIQSGEMDQLTDQDYFTMDSLAISQDGKEIYYSLFDEGREKVTAFSLDDGLEKTAPEANRLPYESYHFRYSPDESKIAYTYVSEESRDSSLFGYELFLLDLKKGEDQRLTNLDSSIVSPRFFHEQNQIAFLENTNWPGEPAEHALNVMDLETEEIHPIELAMSPPKSSQWLPKTIDTLAHGWTVAILYVVLIGLLSTYLFIFHSKKKRYVPVLVSFFLSIIVFSVSFFVAFVVNPWYGIGLGMLATALLGCTVISFGYAFVLKFFVKVD
ncbi:DPP IV N-terminal domain-containing protein [Oceanobacillus rekensis]|uniref:DPP IV N-terminal domain-containing protein n=1 Tax=Oceanobacillus rekensis TaxID=937927 RepID=UPI0015931BE9|nr:DPP IV N-terminal domain-containing protein [Oceanobacillus rekensis]